MKTLLLAFLLIVIFCQRLAARPQFGSGTDLVEGAKREKKLVFYTSMELPQNITVVHSFIEKYPFMDLELHPLDSRTLVKRVQDEARVGISNWDILLGGGGSFQPLFEANMVASYNSPERAAVSELFNDDKGYWSGYYINPYVLGFNTTSIKKEEVPKKYVDLLEPRWKARRIAIDAEAHALLRGLVAAWGEAKAVRYLKRLEQQQPLVAPASIIAVDAVHVGKVSAAIARAPVIQGYKQKLASPIEWVFLAPVVAQIDAAMLSAYARIPSPRAFS